MTALEGIINSIKDTYDGSAWHGPSVKSILSKIPPDKVRFKIGNSHSIIELVLHMVAWRNFVIHKLQGDEAYDVTAEANFPNEKDWAKALTDLDNSQNELLEVLARFDEKKLYDLVPGRKYSFYKLSHGIVHHDTYHQGQIVLITKQF